MQTINYYLKIQCHCIYCWLITKYNLLHIYNSNIKCYNPLKIVQIKIVSSTKCKMKLNICMHSGTYKTKKHKWNNLNTISKSIIIVYFKQRIQFSFFFVIFSCFYFYLTLTLSSLSSPHPHPHPFLLRQALLPLSY